MKITRAVRADLAAILQLQYLAYRSEAELLNDFSIPPLQETLEEMSAQYDRGDIFLKMETGGGLILGSVRGHRTEDTLFIGKLMVHPGWRRKGLGSRLLKHIQTLFPDCRCELFTSTKSKQNIELYRRSGFHIFQEKEIKPGLTFLYLEKYPAG